MQLLKVTLVSEILWTNICREKNPWQIWLIIITEPIVDLLKDAYVQEKVEEAAKLFYTNDTVTINLYWAAAAALLFFLRKFAGPPVVWPAPATTVLCLSSSHPTAGSSLPAFRLIRRRLRSSVHRVNPYCRPECWEFFIFAQFSYGPPEESYGAPAQSYGSPGHSYSRSVSNPHHP